MYVHELITTLQKFPKGVRVLLLDPQRGRLRRDCDNLRSGH